MVSLQEMQVFLLPSLGEAAEWSRDKQNDQLSPHTEESQTFRHSRIHRKTRRSFRPGAENLLGHTNCTHLTENTLKSSN